MRRARYNSFERPGSVTEKAHRARKTSKCNTAAGTESTAKEVGGGGGMLTFSMDREATMMRCSSGDAMNCQIYPLGSPATV